jgi:hypothetical protein
MVLHRCGEVVPTADGPYTALGLATTPKALEFWQRQVGDNYRAAVRGRSIADGHVELYLYGEDLRGLAHEVRGFCKGLQAGHTNNLHLFA